MKILQLVYNTKEKLRNLQYPWMEKVDIPFLLLLLMIVNYRYSLKLVALIIAYILRPNFKFLKTKINYFFLGMIGIGLINFILSGEYQINHFSSVLSGLLIWIVCILIFHQVHLSIQATPSYKILNSIKVIVVLNAIVSIIDIANVSFIIGSFNPYVTFYPPPYGIMSGDLVGGVFGKMHLVNTCVSAIFFVVFLKKKDFIFALLALITFLLTSSNLATIFILLGLVLLFFIQKDKLIKYFSLSFITIIVLFYVVINTSNLYVVIGMFHPKVTESYFQNKTDKILNENDDDKSVVIDSLVTNWIQEKGTTVLTDEVKSRLNDISNLKYNKIIEKNTITTKKTKEKQVETKDGNSKKSSDSNGKEKINQNSITADSGASITIVKIDKTQDNLADSISVDLVSEQKANSVATKTYNDPEDIRNVQIITKKEIKEKQLEKERENLRKSWDYNDNQKRTQDSIIADQNSSLKIFDIDKTPGALISYKQTKDVLFSSVKNFLFGAGTNEFSSRLAFVNSKLVDDSRLFALIPKYENQLFGENHKALFEYLMFAGEETHSVINLPFSGYNQILGEYGIIGFLLFVFFYLGNFLFKWKKLTYGKLIILLIIPLFAFEYWFERFSVMVIFEMILLLNLKENMEVQKANQDNETN